MVNNDVIKVAVDAYHGKVQNYSIEDSQSLVRDHLIELNHNKTSLDLRDVRDGKCGELFAFIEETIARVEPDTFTGNEFFMALVDYRNANEGDQIVFEVEDSDYFYVAEAADGTQGIRRQRIGGVSEVKVPVKLYAIKIYEELNRVLAGRTDFNRLIAKVAESFGKFYQDEVYALWSNITAKDLGGVKYFPVAGSYDEDELLDVVSHVEAAADGKKATIIGTKKALRNLAPSIQGADSRSDLYNLGLKIA